MRHLKRVGGLLLALTLVLGLHTAAYAQTGAAWITGLVTDASGASAPGVTITATNQATNVPYTAVSNEAGNYTIPSVPVGTYTRLLLSGQALPPMMRTPAQLADVARGGYVLVDDGSAPDCILIATGSEVGIAVDAAQRLTAAGHRVRAVSMPCTQAFDAQPQQYRDAVLTPGVPRVAIEAGVRDGWWRYVGTGGAVIGMDTFGASAPAKNLFEHFGCTTDNVVRTVEGLL